MAVDFGILSQGPSIGQSFMAGQQAAQAEAERNMLRQQQQMQFRQQQEDRAFQLQQRQQQAQREEQFTKMADLIRQNGMDPDDPKVLGDFAQAAMQARNPALVSFVGEMAERAAKRRETAAVQKRIQTAMGGVEGPPAPAANALAAPAAVSPAVNAMLAPPAAQPELLAGTPFAVGMAPRAAAPAPTAAPVANNAAKIAELERRRDALELGGSKQELALAAQVQRQIDKLQPKVEAKSPTQKDYEFAVSQGFKGSLFDYKRQLAEAGRTSVTIPISTEKKYGEAFAGNIAKADVEKMATAEGAPALAESANRIIGLVQQGNLFTGPIADVKLNIARALNVAGVDNTEKIANTERLIAATGQSTLDAIKGAGLGTGQGFTDKDLKFLQGVAGGTINLTPQTLTELALLQHRVATKAADSWNRRRQEIPKDVAQGVGLSMTPITVPPLMQKPAPGAARPKGVGNDWTLMTDKNGARAWVSPDRKQVVEVP